MNADELLATKFDDKNLEAEYRRGYSDGFYAAIQSLVLLGNLNKNRIIDVLEKFWYADLGNWAFLSDTTEAVLPPGCFTTCVYCGNQAEEIDHVIPRSKNGANSIDNLAPACRNCNRSKKDKHLEEWKNGRLPR